MKVLDLGLARVRWGTRPTGPGIQVTATGDLGRTGPGSALIGTPDYLAP